MLQLKTMGIFEAKWSGNPLPQFDSDKTRALLAYLAVESGCSHHRETLAGLFWPEKPEKLARHSLSQSIYFLRSTLPGGSDLFHTTAQLVEFHPQANFWLDTGVFKSLLQDIASHCPVSSWVCHACQANLEQVVGLYQGEFMPGFSLGGCEAFDYWLTVQRESLKLMLIQALESLVTSLMNQGAYEKGLVYAQHWYSQDDLNESALRQVMRLLTVMGQRNEALCFFRAFADRLFQELHTAPEPETTRLYQQLLDNSLIRKYQPARSSLSYPLVPILGRQEELGLMAHKMRNPDCRLLTILGPGGIGKTRLAQEASLNLQASFLDGVYWVDLDTRQGEEELLLRIASAVGLTPRSMSDLRGYDPEGNLKAQLIDLLQGKHALLVLDGIEGMYEHADQLSELLHRLPHVKILATSRVRLNLEAEHVLLLNELSYPQKDGALGEADNFPAVRLFIESARRIYPDFMPDPHELAAVVNICQINQGLPLGILLSSAWVGTLTPSQILAEINKSLGFLSAGWQDLPERQRTLLATFDSSWQLLDQALQEVFLRLAVFQGEFTAEQAMQVTEASLVQLKALVDHSLVQHSGKSSFRMHNLLRQYALSKLAAFPDIYQSVNERHSALFLTDLAAFERRLKSSAQFEALAEMDNHMPDLRAAWDWAASHHQFERLANASRALECYGLLRRRYSDSFEAFQKALASFENDIPPRQSLPAWVNLCLRLAYSFYGMRHFSQANDWVEKIEDQLQFLDQEQRSTLLLRGEAAYLRAQLKEFYQVNNQEAFELYQACLEWMRAYDDPWYVSRVLYRFSNVQAILKNKQQTEIVSEEALALQRQVGDPDLTAKIKTSLLNIYTMSGQNEKAICVAQELEPYFHSVGTRYSLAISAMLSGLSHSHAMHFTLSNVFMEKAVNLFDPARNPDQYDFAAYIQTINYLFLGNYDAARRGVNRHGYGPDGVIFPNWQLTRGYLHVLDGSYELAETDFKGYVDHNRYTRRLDVLGHGLGLLSYAVFHMGRVPEALQYLEQALENGLEQGYFMSLKISLVTLNFILAEAEELEQAAELFSLNDLKLFLQNRVYEDLFGKRIRTLLGALLIVYQPKDPFADLKSVAQHYLVKLKSSDGLLSSRTNQKF